MAYILGTAEFWSLMFTVTPDVLIPRPETELCVEWILENYPANADMKVVDLGTGSGAIALALASERSTWHIDAVDNSTAALTIAQKNSNKFGYTQPRFILSNWCKKLDDKYHVIVANPPYIDKGDQHLMEDGLCFEPRSALVSSKNGFQDIEIIISQSYDLLFPNGTLVLEHGFGQQELVCDMCLNRGYSKVEKYLDYNSRARMIVAFK